MFNNQPPPYAGSDAQAVVDLQGERAIIGMAEIVGNFGGPVLRVAGTMSQVSNLRLLGGGSMGPGLVMQANQVRVNGYVGDFISNVTLAGGQQTAFKAGLGNEGDVQFPEKIRFGSSSRSYPRWDFPVPPPAPRTLMRGRGGTVELDATRSQNYGLPTACVVFMPIAAGGPLPNMMYLDLHMEDCNEYLAADASPGQAITASMIRVNAYGGNESVLENGLLVGPPGSFVGADTKLDLIARGPGVRRRSSTGVITLGPLVIQGKGKIVEATAIGLDLALAPLPGQCSAWIVSLQGGTCAAMAPQLSAPVLEPAGNDPRDAIKITLASW